MENKSGRRTILVVDDDRDIVQTIKGNLGLDGYEVLTAFDGKSGLHVGKTAHPDMIILDLNLPDIDGISVCRILRREFDVPIIILTARDGISNTVLGLECGADDYMVKPFNFLELSARIRTIFRRSDRRMIKEEHAFKDLVINFKSREVFIRDVKVKLTKTEFELLELLTSYPGKVLSREFIQKEIWSDSQLYQHSRALDVHIQRLRKKIEKDAENPEYIVTITGVGYRFQAGRRHDKA